MTKSVMDLTGQTYGRWTVLYRTPDKEGRNGRKFVAWHCRCLCGTERDVTTQALRSGRSRSCGCLQRERARDAHYKHGHSKERLYNIWHAMLGRCYKSDNPSYDSYGGRGIQVCVAWRSNYDAFESWAHANGYSDTLTLDRKDVNQGYTPENCRWVDRKTQNNNKRNTMYVEYLGEEWPVGLLADIAAVDLSVLERRLRLGWDVEKAITAPVGSTRWRFVEYQGEVQTISEWARRFGLPKYTLRDRLDAGWSVEDALNTPLRAQKQISYSNND